MLYVQLEVLNFWVGLRTPILYTWGSQVQYYVHAKYRYLLSFTARAFF